MGISKCDYSADTDVKHGPVNQPNVMIFHLPDGQPGLGDPTTWWCEVAPNLRLVLIVCCFGPDLLVTPSVVIQMGGTTAFGQTRLPA